MRKLAEDGNPQKMDYLNHSQKRKLNLILPKLKLLVWLDQRGLYSYKPILADKGYTDIDSLATMSIDAIMELAKEISDYDGHHLFLQELDELRKEVTMKDNVDEELDTPQTAEGWYRRIQMRFFIPLSILIVSS